MVTVAALALILTAPASAGAPPSFLSDLQLGAAVSQLGGMTRAAMESRSGGRSAPTTTVGRATTAELFAFAVRAAGYEEWCRANDCKPSAVVVVQASENVPRGHNGWYSDGNSYIKERPEALSNEITTVHEFAHHLQRLSNRYQQYRGICNQFMAEREAYKAGEAYARSKGFTTNFEKRLAPYEKKCRDAVAAGLIKAPAGLQFD